MTKTISLLFVSVFALSALLVSGLNQPNSGQYLFADEVHEYPPLENSEKQTLADNSVIGYLADEVHEYPPQDKEAVS